jgi:hypothetical protein
MSVLRRSFSAGAGAYVLLVSLLVGVHVCQASLLVARHQLVQVETGGESVIRLTHYDDTSAASVRCILCGAAFFPLFDLS